MLAFVVSNFNGAQLPEIAVTLSGTACCQDRSAQTDQDPLHVFTSSEAYRSSPIVMPPAGFRSPHGGPCGFPVDSHKAS